MPVLQGKRTPSFRDPGNSDVLTPAPPKGRESGVLSEYLTWQLELRISVTGCSAIHGEGEKTFRAARELAHWLSVHGASLSLMYLFGGGKIAPGWISVVFVFPFFSSFKNMIHIISTKYFFQSNEKILGLKLLLYFCSKFVKVKLVTSSFMFIIINIHLVGYSVAHW